MIDIAPAALLSLQQEQRPAAETAFPVSVGWLNTAVHDEARYSIQVVPSARIGYLDGAIRRIAVRKSEIGNMGYWIDGVLVLKSATFAECGVTCDNYDRVDIRMRAHGEE